jgi:Ran-binding protein 1
MSAEEPTVDPQETKAEQPEVDDEHVVEEEVTTVEGWAPSVTLEVNEQITTGEEDEATIYTQRSRLYRWVANTSDDGPAGEWKERGTGDAKLLKNKSTEKIRLLMRQEKTGKIVANHYIVDNVDPYYTLRPVAGSDKIWMWMCQDFSENELAIEQFALKFGNVEKAKDFEIAFNLAKTGKDATPATPQVTPDESAPGTTTETTTEVVAEPVAEAPAPQLAEDSSDKVAE